MAFVTEHEGEDGTFIPSNCAVLRTTDDGNDLELITPSGDGEMTALETFLSAVLFRFHEDPTFVPEMGKWIEENWPEETDLN